MADSRGDDRAAASVARGIQRLKRKARTEAETLLQTLHAGTEARMGKGPGLPADGDSGDQGNPNAVLDVPPAAPAAATSSGTSVVLYFGAPPPLQSRKDKQQKETREVGEPPKKGQGVCTAGCYYVSSTCLQHHPPLHHPPLYHRPLLSYPPPLTPTPRAALHRAGGRQKARLDGSAHGFLYLQNLSKC